MQSPGAPSQVRGGCAATRSGDVGNRVVRGRQAGPCTARPRDPVADFAASPAGEPWLLSGNCNIQDRVLGIGLLTRPAGGLLPPGIGPIWRVTGAWRQQ